MYFKTFLFLGIFCSGLLSRVLLFTGQQVVQPYTSPSCLSLSSGLAQAQDYLTFWEIALPSPHPCN